jgi:hypothetical protein
LINNFFFVARVYGLREYVSPLQQPVNNFLGDAIVDGRIVGKQNGSWFGKQDGYNQCCKLSDQAEKLFNESFLESDEKGYQQDSDD